MGWHVVGMVGCILAGWTPPLGAQTVRLDLHGQAIEGRPMAWSTQKVSMQLRDGSFVEFAPDDARDFSLVSRSFQPYSAGELRAALLREFAGGYDVTGTGQYLVVHPHGQRDVWGNRFEQLYRSMLAYFNSRGFAVQRPEFPLVAVVFPTQQHFVEYARTQGFQGVTAYTLGLYHERTNRIYLYDVTAGQPDSAHWYVNAETIIHEAAHQTAFNLNLHARLADTPIWVIEGLGTMFEARGVWDSQNYRQLSDRINSAQLQLAKAYLAQGNSLEVLQQQLIDDRLFRSHWELAYCHAWSLTFYLSEKEPQRFAEYLKRLRQLEPGTEYGPEDRLRDFTTCFGTDLQLLDARLQRFIASL
jgi:hypothetical protein